MRMELFDFSLEEKWKAEKNIFVFALLFIL